MLYMGVSAARPPQSRAQPMLRGVTVAILPAYGDTMFAFVCGVPTTGTDALAVPSVDCDVAKPVAHTGLGRSPAPRKPIQSTERRRRRPVAAGVSPVALWVFRELSTAQES